jgi:tRNA threonylcarbamoyladenosine biosynthesis protein TsaE
MNSATQFDISQLDACQALAEAVASCARVPLAIGLIGTLGAGKTQWTRFLAIACGVEADSIASPTFTLVHHYPGRIDVYHLDAFRVKTEAEFFDLGVDELFEERAIVVVEWADRFPNCLPQDRLELRFELLGDTRTVTVTSGGERSRQVQESLEAAWRERLQDKR